MEAYGVLSQSESRANYDIIRMKNPAAFAEVDEAEWAKESRFDLRDKSGNTAVKAPAADSYAAERMAELAMQRKKFNANHLGMYMGGLPRPGKGSIRGKALGHVGEFHQPHVHNFIENYHQDSKLVSSEDAVKFKAWMGSDKTDFNRSKPFYAAYHDKNFEFLTERMYWLGLLGVFMAIGYGSGKWTCETDRWARADRMTNIAEKPGHHYHNRGGVLIEKQFIGFEKYHKNLDGMMAWYAKAYPAAFKAE
jgi:hypothetical protein